MSAGTVIAVDLGASSGRVVVAHVGAGQLELQEVHRFSNDPVALPDGLHWDVLRLYHEVLVGLRAASRVAPDAVSIGVDSWAIDYALLDADGALLGEVYHYRDGRATRGVAIVDAAIGRADLYARTGIQFLPFNSVYQLAAARGTAAMGSAASVLLIPDLMGYWLTGTRLAEATNASTTALVGVGGGGWLIDVAQQIGLDPSILPVLASPGTLVGGLRPDVLATTSLASHVALTLTGSHDTASAVVAVPARNDGFAYISCGTWSLVGLELDAPILSEASRLANFTNELGVDGRIRYLRNVMGLWLLQESLRTWELTGTAQDLASLLAAAARLPPRGPVFDPDDPRFLPPGDIPARIGDACGESGQPVPETPAALVRSVLDSLAAAYARTLDDARRLSGRPVNVVHLVGGGSRNTLLCQLTADATGLPVVAGPVETTAIGNALVQARAHGLISGTLEDLRRLVATTQHLERYEPRSRAEVARGGR